MTHQERVLSSAEKPSAPQRVSRWRAARAVLGSFDFYLGVPLGAALGVLPLVSKDAAAQVSVIMLAASGIATGLATLVLTAMTVLLSVFGSAYRAMLTRVPGGVVGTLAPYRQVVVIAVGGSVTALSVALLWPVLGSSPSAVRWVACAAPLALLCWAVLGCVQVVDQVIDHVASNQKAEELEARKAVALAKQEGRLAELRDLGTGPS